MELIYEIDADGKKFTVDMLEECISAMKENGSLRCTMKLHLPLRIRRSLISQCCDSNCLGYSCDGYPTYCCSKIVDKVDQITGSMVTVIDSERDACAMIVNLG